MNMIDPTYLRTIHDGLLSGIVHKDNASALPMGLAGIYEEVIPPVSNVNERKKFLEFFSIWALLKKEVSAAFIVPLMEGWTEDRILAYASRYSKLFNAGGGGKMVLYHERFRSFVLQRIPATQLNACNEAIIRTAGTALERKAGDEWEIYALEYLSSHLLIPAMETNAAAALKSLVNNEAFRKRQLEISKGFEWSKRMLGVWMYWCNKYDDEELIDCALAKIDLYHREQNDAPRILELIVQNDLEAAFQRIEAFAGDDKEGRTRKFILCTLCLLELTLSEVKVRPFHLEGIEKLLNHLNETIPVDHRQLNWHRFLPGMLMARLGFVLHQMGIDTDILFSRTSAWDASWLKDYHPREKTEAEFLVGLIRKVAPADWSSPSLKGIATFLHGLKQSEAVISIEAELDQRSRNRLNIFNDEDEPNPSPKKSDIPPVVEDELRKLQRLTDLKGRDTALSTLIRRCIAHGLMDSAERFAKEQSTARMKAESYKEICEGYAKRGQFESALELATGIRFSGLRNEALNRIFDESIRLAQQEYSWQAALSMDVDYGGRPGALKTLAGLVAGTSDYDNIRMLLLEMLRTTPGVETDWMQSVLLEDIVKTLACSGEWHQAWVLSGEIIEWYRESVIRDLAQILAESKVQEHGREAASEKLSTADLHIVKEVLSKSDATKAQSFQPGLSLVPEDENFNSTTQDPLASGSQVPEQEPDTQVMQLLDLAYKLTEHVEDSALSLLQAAMETAAKTADESRRNQLLIQIGNMSFSMGRFDTAGSAWLGVEDWALLESAIEETIQTALGNKTGELIIKGFMNIDNPRLKQLLVWKYIVALDPGSCTWSVTKPVLQMCWSNPDAINQLLLRHAVHELFIGKPSDEKISRLNRTLHLQWAMEVRKKMNE